MYVLNVAYIDYVIESFPHTMIIEQWRKGKE